MSLDGFWAIIDKQLELARTAKTADDVMTLFASPGSVTGAFFAGSGGDEGVMDSLLSAGWQVTWAEANYYWEMQAPDGSYITYIEGDIMKGKHDAG